MNIHDAIRLRRSVRRFKNKAVPSALLRKVIEDATYAPTNCNQQLWKFVAVTDDRMKDRLVREAYSSTIIRRAPVVLVVCYDGWSYKEAIQGGSFASQNILLSATASGLGALSMNSFGNENVIKRILSIPEQYIINCFVLLGYADDIYKTTPVVERRPVGEVLSFNTFTLQHAIHRSYDTRRWTTSDLIDYQKYYCRKTFLGKRMDIMDDTERELVKRVLEKSCAGKKSVIDFFSYDGAYLDLFLQLLSEKGTKTPSLSVTSVNLDSETGRYVEAAVDMYCKDSNGKNDEKNDGRNDGKKDGNNLMNCDLMNYVLFDSMRKNVATGARGATGMAGSFDCATMLFKAERLSPALRRESFAAAAQALDRGGEIVIVSRLPSLLFSIFYYGIILLFGDDIRRTGIYAFWGPYRPVSRRVLCNELRQRGFDIASSKAYCTIPPFFNQALQMLIQYVKSGGSSYLHREKHVNIFTRLLEWLVHIQGMKPAICGSVAVIRARKK